MCYKNSSMQIKNYINVNYPTCPSVVTIPDCYVKKPVDNDAYYMIVPNPSRYNRLDWPFVEAADIPDNFKLFQPLYHKGFILLKGSQNGQGAMEVPVNIFDIINTNSKPEHMTLKNLMTVILQNKSDQRNLQSLANVCQTCPDMLDLALSHDFELEWIKYRPRITEMVQVEKGLDLLRSFLDCNYEFVMPKAYIVHLPSRQDRHKRMEGRMKELGLEYEFVHGYHYEDSHIDEMMIGADNINIGRIYNRRAQFACLYSHLKAIETFYNSGESVGFIFEDDCCFRKNFNEVIKPILYRLSRKSEFNLCSLLISNESFYREVNVDPGINNDKIEHIELVKLDNRAWGLVGYIISHKYAGECLEKFKKPIVDVPHVPLYPNYVTSEIIPMYSEGWATSLPLVLDELGESNIAPQNAAIHKNMFSYLGLDNFEIPVDYN